MGPIVPIDDPADDRVSDYIGLSDPDLRRMRARSAGGEGGFFIAEGGIVIRHLLRSPYRLRSVLVTERGRRDLGPELEGVDAPVYLASQAVVERIAGFHFHRGSLASAQRPPARAFTSLVETTSVVVVVEGVTDHENLGALFRNAAGFGAGAVLLDPTSPDPLYRRSLRVSMGHVLRVPFARLPDWPGDLARLRSLGFTLLALTPAASAEDVARIEPVPRLAVLVGAEGRGLSAAALAAAHRRVRIPLAPAVDSLNVATAAAIALHRLVPQS